MWINYGKIFAEYPFIKDFRSSDKINKITIENKMYLDEFSYSYSEVNCFI